METAEIIRDRIKNRRYQIIGEKPEKKGAQKGKIFNSFIKSSLVICSFLLSGLIYMKSDERGQWLFSNFGLKGDFSTINQTMDTFVTQFLQWDILLPFLGEDQIVSGDPLYVELGPNRYINASNSAVAVDAGRVLLVEENNDGSNLVIIAHDHGFIASYLNVFDCQVNLNDRVEAQELLGIMNQSLGIIFHIQEESRTYVEILKLLD